MAPLAHASEAEREAILSDLVDLPPKPPRSKLEPHRELIRELRRKGRTYREVARLFRERLGLHVAPSTLHADLQWPIVIRNYRCARLAAI